MSGLLRVPHGGIPLLATETIAVQQVRSEMEYCQPSRLDVQEVIA